MSIKDTWGQFIKNKTTDFRFITFGIISCCLLILLFSEFYLGSYVVLGKYLVLYPMPYFADLRILLCGIDAIRDHLNPYEVSCFATDKFPYFNYPYTWGFLSFIPFITIHNILYIGIGTVLLFFISLYFFVGRISFLESIIYTVLILSPAIMLGLDRGNCDIIIFLLLLIPIFKNSSQKLFAFDILICSMLKFYPIGAIVGIFHRLRSNKKKTLILFVSTGLMFLIYIFLMRDNILQVSAQTPRPFRGDCYGLGTILTKLTVSHPSLKTYIFIFYPLLLIFGLVLFYHLPGKKLITLRFSENRAGLSFITGSSIFITTCLIGYNFEYRLVFLLFTIPQILRWISEKKQYVFFLLIITMLLLWQPYLAVLFGSHYFLIGQLFVVILFYCHTSILFNYIKENLKPVQLIIFTGKTS